MGPERTRKPLKEFSKRSQRKNQHSKKSTTLPSTKRNVPPTTLSGTELLNTSLMLKRDTTLSWNRRELLKKPSILWTATWKAFKMPMILPREKEKSRHNSSRMKLTTMFQNTTQQRMVLQNSQKNLKNLKLLRDNDLANKFALANEQDDSVRR